MSSFTGERVLAELLGFAALWCATWSKRLPQLDLGHPSSTEATGVAGAWRTTFPRLAAAVSLVLFQTFLIGANRDSRWAIPLVTTIVFALTRLSIRMDRASLRSYYLIAPAAWSSSKFDLRDPVLLPFSSIILSIFLASSDFHSMHSMLPGFFLLASGAAFFGFIFQTVKSPEVILEKDTEDNEQGLLRSMAAVACGFSLVIMISIASKAVLSFNLLLLFGVALRAVQVYGLLMFTTESVLAASSTVTAAGIAAGICQTGTVAGLGSILALFGAIGQAVMTIPKSNDKRYALFMLLFVPGLILPVISNYTLAPSTVKAAMFGETTGFSKSIFAQTHPITVLQRKWMKHHEMRLAKQSKTLEQAVREYQRRYHRDPPPGFDRWWKFAQQNRYLLPDEFDGLMTSMEPFWRVTPTDLFARMKSAAFFGDAIVEVGITDNYMTGQSGDHWYINAIGKYFENFAHLGVMPDMNFSVNVLDEPRAVFHPLLADDPSQIRPKLPTTHESRLDKNEVKWVDINHTPIWPVMAGSCPNLGRPEINDESSYTYSSHGIDFMDASGGTQDVCVSSSLRLEHGFFLAPTSMKITHNVVPIFSQAAPQGFNDILYPTPFYYDTMDAIKDDNVGDPEWTDKKDVVYWAGSSTGGQSTIENWRHLHRSRVSLMTSNTSTEVVTLLERGKLGRWSSYKTWWRNIAQLFNMRITGLVQCEEDARNEMESIFHTGEHEREPSNNSLGYKYVLDIDGNSYTGRYYRLLASNSCVIKSTVFREWHDDILVPWVHYIPLSNGAQEFGELMRFLTQEPEGNAIGAAIAAQSKDWMSKALKQQHMVVYAMRVFMEYGRLFDEQRDYNGFKLGDS